MPEPKAIASRLGKKANPYLCLWPGQSQSGGLVYWDFAQKIRVLGSR